MRSWSSGAHGFPFPWWNLSAKGRARSSSEGEYLGWSTHYFPVLDTHWVPHFSTATSTETYFLTLWASLMAFASPQIRWTVNVWHSWLNFCKHTTLLTPDFIFFTIVSASLLALKHKKLWTWSCILLSCSQFHSTMSSFSRILSLFFIDSSSSLGLSSVSRNVTTLKRLLSCLSTLLSTYGNELKSLFTSNMSRPLFAFFVLDVHLPLQHLILHKQRQLRMLRFPRLHLRAQHAHHDSELFLGRHGISSAQCECSKRRYHARWLWCVRACFLSHIEGSHQFDGVTSVKESSTQEDTIEQKSGSLHNRKIHLRGEGSYSASGPSSVQCPDESVIRHRREGVDTFLPLGQQLTFERYAHRKQSCTTARNTRPRHDVVIRVCTDRYFLPVKRNFKRYPRVSVHIVDQKSREQTVFYLLMVLRISTW